MTNSYTLDIAYISIFFVALFKDTSLIVDNFTLLFDKFSKLSFIGLKD